MGMPFRNTSSMLSSHRLFRHPVPSNGSDRERRTRKQHPLLSLTKSLTLRMPVPPTKLMLSVRLLMDLSPQTLTLPHLSLARFKQLPMLSLVLLNNSSMSTGLMSMSTDIDTNSLSSSTTRERHSSRLSTLPGSPGPKPASMLFRMLLLVPQPVQKASRASWLTSSESGRLMQLPLDLMLLEQLAPKKINSSRKLSRESGPLSPKKPQELRHGSQLSLMERETALLLHRMLSELLLLMLWLTNLTILVALLERSVMLSRLPRKLRSRRSCRPSTAMDTIHTSQDTSQFSRRLLKLSLLHLLSSTQLLSHNQR